MSMTKREMDEAADVAITVRAAARKNCGCYYNWDDKFWTLCGACAEDEIRRWEDERGEAEFDESAGNAVYGVYLEGGF